MDSGRLIHVLAFPGWVVGVTYRRSLGFQSWVITPERVVLSDGEVYSSDKAALAAGRTLVELSLESGTDTGRSQSSEG